MASGWKNSRGDVWFEGEKLSCRQIRRSSSNDAVLKRMPVFLREMQIRRHREDNSRALLPLAQHKYDSQK